MRTDPQAGLESSGYPQPLRISVPLSLTASTSQDPEPSLRTGTLQPAVQTMSPQPVRYRCDKCGHSFARLHDRNRHYEATHSETPRIYRCERCRKQFLRADARKRHQDGGKCCNGVLDAVEGAMASQLSGILPLTPESEQSVTRDDWEETEKRQLRPPPSSTLLAPAPMNTASTTGRNKVPTGLSPPQSTAAVQLHWT